MAAEDTDNARLSVPPRAPWTVAATTPEALHRVADETALATWRLGLRRWFWGEGVCLLGLVRSARAWGEPVPAAVVDWYDARLADPAADPTALLDHVNEVAPGAAASLLVADADRAAYLPALDRLRSWTLRPEVTRDPNGAIEHWPGGVWADTMVMVGVFLMRLGELRRDRELVAEGVDQVLAHAALLQDATGLFVHGTHRGEAIPCHWGRANAWAALALVEALEVDAGLVDAGAREEVTQRLEAQLVALTRTQPAHGIWDVLVDGHPETAGIAESSAAAGVAAAMLRAGPPLGTDRFTEPGWRALRGVLGQVDDGVLTRVSAGTVLQLIPFGYSVIRDDRAQPWGQGLLLQALAAAGDAIRRGEPAR
ncbi:unsaturated rhamnogalacturonyl hydrolase [Knoellia remsis]|uniref:Unsaturated rhamnogalacturonyl hydrolase n=1 Tax=Knoellia remsis TaxID=407159 RepID=A0A2T0UK94_9MICO|nr:glycoside hydrolase family 88 protein [Knoellia remsis]PRY58247.1 unsaturated rhamnogalacturonyl hydrolase [Knoellia remsis]